MFLLDGKKLGMLRQQAENQTDQSGVNRLRKQGFLSSQQTSWQLLRKQELK